MKEMSIISNDLRSSSYLNFLIRFSCTQAFSLINSSVRYKACLSDSSYTTEANLMKLHRKIKHNKKVCRAHDFGSLAQGQGRNQVRGQNRASAITQKLLKQIKRNFTER